MIKSEIKVSTTSPIDLAVHAYWQGTVDAAEAMSRLGHARCNGLVTGGPEVDIQRCDDILERGRQLGITPRPDSVERLVRGLTSR